MQPVELMVGNVALAEPGDTLLTHVEVIGSDAESSRVMLDASFRAPADTSANHIELVRNSAGISYLISLLTLAIFVILQRIRRWPLRNGFLRKQQNWSDYRLGLYLDRVNMSCASSRLRSCKSKRLCRSAVTRKGR